ncbi:MAG: helix-turn-helix domain containing protein [Clostridiaceae bacterium]|nr:helix-turn-helix domain containing protein [Clostridiaceae bacterium]
MPPKPKFTKEEIVAAALELVSKNGIESLTARELSKYLGSSARPIFTVFKSMEEVAQAVREAAMGKYEEFVGKALDYFPEFKKYGMQMIAFSKQEPKLFQLLFMTENKSAESFRDVFSILGKTARACIDIIERDYKLEPDRAMLLFEHAWIHSFGICVMCAMGTCRFTDDEISQMLSDNFMGMMMLTKSDFANQNAITPHRKITE